jgi:hypothetical protein
VHRITALDVRLGAGCSQDDHRDGKQVAVGLHLRKNFQTPTARQIEIEHHQARPGHTGEFVCFPEKAQRLLAIHRHVQVNGHR